MPGTAAGAAKARARREAQLERQRREEAAIVAAEEGAIYAPAGAVRAVGPDASSSDEDAEQAPQSALPVVAPISPDAEDGARDAATFLRAVVRGRVRSPVHVRVQAAGKLLDVWQAERRAAGGGRQFGPLAADPATLQALAQVLSRRQAVTVDAVPADSGQSAGAEPGDASQQPGQQPA